MSNIALQSRQVLEKRYKDARNSLLLVALFTTINVVFVALGKDVFFLFSAYMPYLFTFAGLLFGGRFPAEYYEQDSFVFLLSPSLRTTILTVMFVLAVIPMIVYFLSWIFSKNNKAAWLITSLVFFSLDTLLMLRLNGFGFDALLDLFFHGWVIFSLAMGISASYKLRKLPTEEPVPAEESGEPVEESENSGMLRIADAGVKQRVLLQTEILGHAVLYRRVKRTNELVIDGCVYDEYVALAETKHALFARIGGHDIEVGFDGVAHSYAKLDGELVAKKLRLY